jgi:hypothetical protein
MRMDNFSELLPFASMILRGREDLTPWLGGVFVGQHFRRQGYWCRTLCHRRGRGWVARDKQSVFVHARQAGMVFTPRLDSTCPVCLARAGEIMCKHLQIV